MTSISHSTPSNNQSQLSLLETIYQTFPTCRDFKKVPQPTVPLNILEGGLLTHIRVVSILPLLVYPVCRASNQFQGKNSYSNPYTKKKDCQIRRG